MTGSLPETVPLTFVRGGPAKWYARTPKGELAYSDYQGLYEWRDSHRIDYSGGDRQISDHRGMHTLHSAPEPRLRGFMAAKANALWGGGAA